MKKKAYEFCFYSPIGDLGVICSDKGLSGLFFLPEEHSLATLDEFDKTPVINQLLEELIAYFKGDLKKFEVPLDLSGTHFQLSVWSALQEIPYAGVRSYQDIANVIGNPRAVRAVGNANRHNPISIVVPCHRVIGKNGALVGFGGGIWRKEWLLAHEQQHKNNSIFSPLVS